MQKDSRDWKIARAKGDLKNRGDCRQKILYRPFDFRFTFYTGKSKGFIGTPGDRVMRHFIGRENIGLIAPRNCKGPNGFQHGLVSKHIVDVASGDIHSGIGTFFFPLWVWEKEKKKAIEEEVRRANFNKEVAEKFAKRMGMEYSEEDKGSGIVSPEALFDYIYAILHRPLYRQDFAAFLRINYPRIPAAADEKEFLRMSKLGGELRELHLLESPFLDGAGHPFSAGGENKVDKIRFAPDSSSGEVRGRVYINAKRYFADVPLVAWEYCVGGYYPAQKWLKDRKGRSLNFDDQRHYRRMLSALARTAELVGKLDGK